VDYYLSTHSKMVYYVLSEESFESHCRYVY
jgi:hypothetical protein